VNAKEKLEGSEERERVAMEWISGLEGEKAVDQGRIVDFEVREIAVYVL
jgi:hypothetical protein